MPKTKQTVPSRDFADAARDIADEVCNNLPDLGISYALAIGYKGSYIWHFAVRCKEVKKLKELRSEFLKFIDGRIDELQK